MGLAVAIQMDPIETINIDADSTFALALEAQPRPRDVHTCRALTLATAALRQGPAARSVSGARNHHRFGAFEELDLADRRDLMRQTAVRHGLHHGDHLLDCCRRGRWSSTTPRRCATPPKNCSSCASRIDAPTLLSLDPNQIRAFWASTATSC